MKRPQTNFHACTMTES